MFCHHDVWGTSTLLARLQIRCESLSRQHDKQRRRKKKCLKRNQLSSISSYGIDKYKDKAGLWMSETGSRDSKPGMKTHFLPNFKQIKDVI